MNQNIITLIIVVGALAAYSGIIFAAQKLKGKKINATKVIEKVDAGLGYAQSIATAISPFLPKIADTVISKVLSVSQQAVTRVEATYKAAISTDANAPDTRKTEATSLVKSALALNGIEDTADIDKLIGTVIPLLVLALPKTHTAAQKAISGTDGKVTTVTDKTVQTAAQA